MVLWQLACRAVLLLQVIPKKLRCHRSLGCKCTRGFIFLCCGSL